MLDENHRLSLGLTMLMNSVFFLFVGFSPTATNGCTRSLLFAGELGFACVRGLRSWPRSSTLA